MGSFLVHQVEQDVKHAKSEQTLQREIKGFKSDNVKLNLPSVHVVPAGPTK